MIDELFVCTFQQIISLIYKTIQLMVCLHKRIDRSSSKLVVSQSFIMIGRVIWVTLKVSWVIQVFFLLLLFSLHQKIFWCASTRKKHFLMKIINLNIWSGFLGAFKHSRPEQLCHSVNRTKKIPLDSHSSWHACRVCHLITYFQG